MSVMGEQGHGVGASVYLAACHLLRMNWLLQVDDFSRRYLRSRRWRRWLRRRGGCVTLLLLLLLLLLLALVVILVFRVVIGESLSMKWNSGTAGRRNLQIVP